MGLSTISLRNRDVVRDFGGEDVAAAAAGSFLGRYVTQATTAVCAWIGIAGMGTLATKMDSMRGGGRYELGQQEVRTNEYMDNLSGRVQELQDPEQVSGFFGELGPNVLSPLEQAADSYGSAHSVLDAAVNEQALREIAEEAMADPDAVNQASWGNALYYGAIGAAIGFGTFKVTQAVCNQYLGKGQTANLISTAVAVAAAVTVTSYFVG